MKQVIYVDVLICVNLIINYFILLAMTKFLYIKTKRIRLVGASLLGAVYSIIILLPEINSLLSLSIKLLMSISIIGAAFGFSNFKNVFRNTLIFYIINFIFGGIVFCLWYFFGPQSIFMKNGVVYLDISPIFLAFTTIISYFLIRLTDRILLQKNLTSTNCEIIVKINKKQVKLKAKIDTGNILKEPFSGLPVVVVEKQYIENILPKEFNDICYTQGLTPHQTALNLKCRMIPFTTVSGQGMIPAFKADEVTILYNKNTYIKEAYIGVCSKKILNTDFSAIINPDLLI